MPNINDVFPSKFLKAHELNGAQPIVTIERVEFEPVGRDREMKAVVYFAGKSKGVVLNKTNATKIIEISGSSITEEWPGTRVRLYTTEATFGGETYDVVRIKAPGAPGVRAVPPPPPPPIEPLEQITDDEIPF